MVLAISTPLHLGTFHVRLQDVVNAFSRISLRLTCESYRAVLRDCKMLL